MTTSSAPMFADEMTQRIVKFLIEIGIEVRAETIGKETFLPGILIRDGVLIVDESRLKHPGDLLHEAGHLAVVKPEKRRRMGTDAGIQWVEEIAATAWSWAALEHLGVPPEVVFHPAAYDGGWGENLIEAFNDNRGPGIPALAWFGMCSDPNSGPDCAPSKLPPFPTMTRWLRESDEP